MPNEFTLDLLIKRLIIVEKIKEGFKDYEEGNVLTEAEMDKEMAELFK